MIPVTLARLAEDCRGRLGAHNPSPADVSEDLVSALTTDTRTIDGGEVFAAIRGGRVDGARLAGQALEAGASAVVTSTPEAALASGAAPERLVVVEDVPKAIGRLARANLERVRRTGNPDLRVVAVTGSVGKTTTKDLLAALLASRGPIIAPPGSLNNEIGLPLTVLRADENTATLVLEMGADRLGNIDYLTSIAPPDVGVVLAVARAHLGEFGGIENVAKAKAELVAGVREGGAVVLNADDARVAAMGRLARGPVVTFSASGEGDVCARDVRLADDGRASFLLVTDEGVRDVGLRLVGEHHVANALAAAAVARLVGIGGADIASTLGRTGAASPHRMDLFEFRGATIVDDSYNANPDSMRAGLAALGRLGEGRRRIAVLGEMLELGMESAGEHAALGAVAKDAGVSTLVCLGEGTLELSAAASDEGIRVYDVPCVDDALALLCALVVEGDVVLLKGSNGSGVWRIADALREEAI